MIKLETLLRDTAAQFPDRPAVQFRDQRLSYAGVVDALDGMDQEIGAVENRRAIILLPDGLPSYLCHLYLFLRGGILVPISIQTATAKIGSLLERTQPHFVITNQLLRTRHLAVFERFSCLIVEPADPLPAQGPRLHFVGSDFGSSFDALARSPEVVRMIVFTSGSTGEPKGVCLTEDNVAAAAGMNVSSLSLGPSRKSLITVPLYDYYGFIQIYSHILAGCGFILGESIGFPEQIFQKITRESVTDLVLVPHTLRELLRLAAGPRAEAMRHLRYVTSSSDTLLPELLRQAFEVNPEVTIFNIYGLTEAGRASFRKIEQSSPPSNSIGRASVGVEILIDGTDDAQGEIVIRGPNVMAGYLEGIEDDRITLKPCSEMRTGDIGFTDERGEINLLGRRDHILNVKGAKMHPSEIERVALQAPGVADALARPCPDEDGEISICLEIVPANEQHDLPAIRRHMRQNLPSLFVPTRIDLVPKIRRTEIGAKVIR